MVRKRILFLSSLFPNMKEPNSAPFNRHQMIQLSEYFDFDIIAPIAWTKRLSSFNFNCKSNLGRQRVYHPTYYHLPRIKRHWYGGLFYLSIFRNYSRLARVNKYDAVFGSWLFPDGWAALKIAELLHLPCFIKVHGSDVNDLAPMTKVAELSLQVAKKAKKVFCVSEALRGKLVKLGASPENLEVVYNGFDSKLFRPVGRENARRALGIERTGRCILYVGNLKESKGLRELALAFRSLCHRLNDPSLWLAVVGTGPYETKFREILRRNGMANRVFFAGSQPQDKVALWMNGANVLCLPSYMEGVPNVVIESLACGTVVVASDVGGVPELKAGAEGLFMVPARDVLGLADGLVRSLQGNCRVKLPPFIGSWNENASLITQHMGLD